MATPLDIDAFKAKLATGGARSNLFRVILPFPAGTAGNTELASFMIKSASLPASTVAEITVPFRGRQIKVAGDRTFADWSVTVINDNDFGIRDAFERWMNVINGHISNVGTMSMAAYQVDATVEQLNRAGEVVKTYKMVGIFPTELGDIQVSYDNNDQIEEFTTNFAVNNWTSNTTS